MKNRSTDLVARGLMFLAMCALTVYIAHFVLPGVLDQTQPDLRFNPVGQYGLFAALTIGGILIGFWVVFGGLIRRPQNQK